MLRGTEGAGLSTLGTDGFGTGPYGRDLAAVLGHFDVRDGVIGTRYERAGHMLVLERAERFAHDVDAFARRTLRGSQMP